MGVMVTGAGAILTVAGAVSATVGLVVLGVLIIAAGAGYLTIVAHRFWVVCRFRPTDETIIVEPTHPKFDAAARSLYLKAL